MVGDGGVGRAGIRFPADYCSGRCPPPIMAIRVVSTVHERAVMSIHVQCPNCGKRLTSKDELAGQNATCPGCKKVMVVPAISPAVPSALAEDGAVLFILPESIPRNPLFGDVDWSNLKPSDLLVRALETRDEATVCHAFRCCQFHFDKACGLMSRGAYKDADRHYVMGGCDRHDLPYFLKRWKVSFEDAIALETLSESRGKDIVTDHDRDMCYRELPSWAPCVECGTAHAKPGSWRSSRGVCPRCHATVNFAEQQQNQLIAAVVRDKVPIAVVEFKARLRSAYAAWCKPFATDKFAPQLQTLISLVLANRKS